MLRVLHAKTKLMKERVQFNSTASPKQRGRRHTGIQNSERTVLFQSDFTHLVSAAEFSFFKLLTDTPESLLFPGALGEAARRFILVGTARTGRGILDGRRLRGLAGFKESEVHVIPGMYT